MKTLFPDRAQAGRLLASKLDHYANRADTIVLALPRGGVPVAAEVAAALNAPLDVFLVRKLGVPDAEELAMGAIASGGIRVLNPEIVGSFRVPQRIIDEVALKEMTELERRESLYRKNRPPLELTGKVVILVDDGIATGATMHAAVQAVRTRQPARIVVSAPVAAQSSCRQLENISDEVVVLLVPASFEAVGQWYTRFHQVSDDEVRAILAQTSARRQESHAR